MESGEPMSNSFEDPQFQRALEASMTDFSPVTATSTMAESAPDGHEPSGSPINTPESPPPRYTIEDCIRDIAARHTQVLPVIYDKAGDTWIFIDPPTQQLEQTDEDYDIYCRHYADPILMRSDKLIRASATFKELLGPSQQFRIKRRRGLVGKLPPHVKYVLDLTPPTEGDDAVYLTASLCCSEGVRFWHQAREVWNVSGQLVGGIEEWSTPRSPQRPTSEDDALEYSPIRHRSAIERVLAAINGSDISLDSAVKVWSTTVVAEYFGITCHTCTFLTDALLTWLRVEPNYYFIEVNPEVTLRIAVGIENENLARDAFAILVGEEALESLVNSPEHSGKITHSTFGRKKDALPETWLQRIEYASKSLIERHTKDTTDLLGNDMQWIESQPAVRKLRSYADPELQRLAERLIRELKSFIHGEIYDILFYASAPRCMPSSQTDTQSRLVPDKHKSRLYEDLPPSERVFTRLFWEKLHSNMPSNQLAFQPSRQHHAALLKFQDDPLIQKSLPALYPVVTMGSLRNLVNTGQILLDQSTSGRFEPFEPSRWTSTATLEDTDHIAWQGSLDATKSPDAQSPTISEFPAPESFSSWEKRNLPYRTQQQKKSFPYLEEARTFADEASLAVWNEAPSLDHFAPDHHPSEAKAFRRADAKQDAGLFRTGFFDLEAFFREVGEHVRRLADRKLAPADWNTRHDVYRPKLIETLTSLSENEWKYLPLWAGGLDDETGAIFSDDVMDAAPGADFSTAGPGIHMGSSTYSNSSAGSDFDMMSDAGSASTSFNLSTAVNDGRSDQLFRGKIYTPSDTASSLSEDDTIDAGDDMEEEEKAKAIVQSLESSQVVEAEAKRLDRTLHLNPANDVCYDDLFAEDEDDGYDSEATERGDDFEDLGDEFATGGDGVMV